MIRLAALGLLGCAAAPPSGAPCDTLGEPSLEVAPADVDFGDFEGGGDFLYGTPPQGGAPFSPFHARVGGIPDLDQGASIRLVATDSDDGTPLGDTTYALRLVCANVGASAGQWLGTDLHQRFDGFSLDDLEGRAMTLSLSVENEAGDVVAAELDGELVPM